MADIFTKERRSEIMSRIKSRDTKPEIVLRKKLFSQGYRYRINYKKLPGKPDIVLSKYKTVIFVHGCFWHGHEGCKDAHLPKTNVAFWEKKINENINRDKKVIELLEQKGFNVLVVWECQLIPGKFNATLDRISAALSGV
ncbi:MAG TPA: very short patch repair endonuclease [Porphyromonadaceae bacterium]|nr:very short patch repair endonuclease [Porphyromonadaceae bacterium]